MTPVLIYAVSPSSSKIRKGMFQQYFITSSYQKLLFLLRIVPAIISSAVIPVATVVSVLVGAVGRVGGGDRWIISVNYALSQRKHHSRTKGSNICLF